MSEVPDSTPTTSKLALFIAEKNKKIEFNVPNTELKRNDYLSLKEKILKMTPEQRKNLGINKSTLFYMKYINFFVMTILWSSIHIKF